jgi:hypothetical protein
LCSAQGGNRDLAILQALEHFNLLVAPGGAEQEQRDIETIAKLGAIRVFKRDKLGVQADSAVFALAGTQRDEAFGITCIGFAKALFGQAALLMLGKRPLRILVGDEICEFLQRCVGQPLDR